MKTSIFCIDRVILFFF